MLSIRNITKSEILYTQPSKSNLNNIVNIKYVFPSLSANKISKIYKVISNKSKKNKPKINMTIKDLSYYKLKTFSIGQANKPYIKINTRELNEKLCTELFTIYVIRQEYGQTLARVRVSWT